MSLMNGIDSEEIIGRTVGMEHVLPALIKVASHKEEDGYHFDPPTTLGIIFGEPSAPFDSERVKAVEELFADTGIHFRSTEYIQEEIWCKFCLNVCSNLPQAILGAGVGCYRDSVHMKAISDGLKRELEAVAQAKGIDMSKTEKLVRTWKCGSTVSQIFHLAGSGCRMPHGNRYVLRRACSDWEKSLESRCRIMNTPII